MSNLMEIVLTSLVVLPVLISFVVVGLLVVPIVFDLAIVKIWDKIKLKEGRKNEKDSR
jgi:hypothetical protein